MVWEVTNRTLLSADCTWVRDEHGTEIWVVAVRASFDIDGRGHVTLAREQQEVQVAPAYVGEPGRSSLKYDTDLVRTKPSTDVLVHGTAYAPAGRPVRSVDVSLTVGPVTKSVRIFGDRTWTRGLLGLHPGTPHEFSRMPICYERAYGGMSADPKAPGGIRMERANPIGVGLLPQVDAPLPNVEDPRDLIISSRSHTHPVGLGPIPCDWSPRVERAGTYDERWARERMPLVPDDFRVDYFQSAPVDQCAPRYLQGGEDVHLINLSAEGELRFHLPRIRLGCRTRVGGAIHHHAMQLYTVILEPDQHCFRMVWHSSLPCPFDGHRLLETIIYEKAYLDGRSEDYRLVTDGVGK